MSHEVENMFYYGEVPWHGLGTPVDHALTAEEAIVAAGLDFTVEMTPVYTLSRNEAEMVPVPERSAVRRTSDSRVYSIMSKGFVPIQNREAFSFFDSVVATKEAKYHTAGSLSNGARIWMLAKIGNGSISVRGDAVDKYLLLMNSHDGSTALKMFFTPVRVVCNNTLSSAESRALSARQAMFYARHTGVIKDRMTLEARDVLGIALEWYDDFTTKANWLATHQLSPGQLPKMLMAAFEAPDFTKIPMEQAIDLSKHREKQYATVTALFEGQGKGLDNPAIKGTKWAAYNAVTEYVDYGRRHGSEDLRLRSVWTGSGATIKIRAWDYLLKGS